MIPVGDVIPARTPPVVTLVLTGTTVAAFALELTLSRLELRDVLRIWGAVPADFRLLQAATSLLLHAGLVHLAGNMLVLWLFGPTLEDRMGHGRFLLFYVGCGLAGAAAHARLDPTALVPAVGASGAVAGVLGAYFLLYPRSRILVLVPALVRVEVIEVRAAALAALWAGLQIAGGAGPLLTIRATTLATWTPVGAQVVAAVAGAALVLALRRPERLRVEWWDPAARNRS